MMLNIFAVTGAGIAAAALSAVLKQHNKEYSLYISLAASAVILTAVMLAVGPLIDLVDALREASGIKSEYIAVLMKALAVCYITQLASDCCRDCGEKAIGDKIDFAGKIAILLISVPLFESLMDIIKGLII